MKRRIISWGLIIFLCVSFFSTLLPNSASATAGPFISPNLIDTAAQNTDANALALCLTGRNGRGETTRAEEGDHGQWIIKQSDIVDNKWFDDATNTQVRQYYNHMDGVGGIGNDANLDCARRVNPKEFGRHLGFPDIDHNMVSYACAIGFVKRSTTGEDCISGKSDFALVTLSKSQILANIAKFATKRVENEYTQQQYYLMAMDVLQNSASCNAHAEATVTEANANPDLSARVQGLPKVQVVSQNGDIAETFYKVDGNESIRWAFRNGWGDDKTAHTETCAGLIGVANGAAGAYAKWLKNNPIGTKGNATTCGDYVDRLKNSREDLANNDKLVESIKKACEDGQKNTDPGFCGKTFTDDPLTYEACKYGQSIPVPVASSTGDKTETKNSCTLQTALGWIICPAVNLLASITDGVYGTFIEPLLETTNQAGNGDIRKSPIYAAWQPMQTFANVIFVIAFLLVIYSQLTGMGISNYGIKKMLPKLIVYAILINLSLYVCLALMDISNILGRGVYDLLVGIFKQVTSPPSWAAVSQAILAGGVVNIVGGTAAGAAIVLGGTGAVAGLAWIFVPIVIGAVIAVVVAALVLVARQALLVILVVASPIALACALLPNTTSLFDKWKKLFTSLLIFFPIFSLVFGGAKLAGGILISTSTNAGNNAGLFLIAGMAAQVLPLFMVPFILKSSGGILGKAYSQLQGGISKLSAPINKFAKGKAKTSAELGLARSRLKAIEYSARTNESSGRIRKGVSSIINLGTSRKSEKELGRLRTAENAAAGYEGADALQRIQMAQAAMETRDYEEAVKYADDAATQNNISYMDRLNAAITGELNGKKLSEAERDSHIRFMMANGNFDERRKVLDTIQGMSRRQRRSAVNGARAKGDTAVYGSSTLGMLAEGDLSERDKDGSITKTHASFSDLLDAGAIKKIESGEATPETFTRDTYTATYQANMAARASVPAQKKYIKALVDYTKTEQGAKVATAIKDKIPTSAVASTPTASPSPSAPTPTSTPTASPSPSAPTPTASGDLSIDHDALSSGAGSGEGWSGEI